MGKEPNSAIEVFIMINAGTTCFCRAMVLFLGMMGLFVTTTSARAQSIRTQVIADFANEAAIKKIAVGKGVRISRTADNMLEVRIAPYSQHKNQWPLIAFGPDFFGKSINLAGFSRLEVVLHQQSEGMSTVDFGIATANDGTRGVDSESLLIPGHTTMTGRLAMKAMQYNDPSEIALMQMVFRPREVETVYRLEPVRAVYDPSVGSPAEDLLAKAASARDHFNQLKRELPTRLSGEQKTAALQKLAALGRRLDELMSEINQARPRQFYKVYRTLSQKVTEVIGEISRLRFAGSGPLWVWEADRYPNIQRKTGPQVQDESLKQIGLGMAGDEYRDVVLMVSPPDRDMSLNVTVRPAGQNPLPAQAVSASVVEYLKNERGEEIGDALLPVSGAVHVPAGESRQLWLRFDTRSAPLKAGRYTFELAIADEAGQLKQVYPGKVEVWDFSLPSYDILPNNSYAEFPSSSFSSGEGFRQAVREMKRYGLNQIFIHPVELPRPKGLDAQGEITGYDDDDAFVQRLTGAQLAWKEAPGDERLNFIISLSGFAEMGLKREGYAFPNAQWKAVFAQWLDHLKQLIAQSGLKDDQWMLVLADESGEPALMQLEIPLAEAIKSLDPSIRIQCNTSTMLSDAQWSERFFKSFDVFQPNLGASDEVLQWLKRSGKPIWVYQCEGGLQLMGKDLYTYYRVYGWELLQRGYSGTGMWTYSAQAPAWNDPREGCLLIFKHPQLGLVHSRRYEMFREGVDDYRYVAALRRAAEKQGGDAAAQAEALIKQAVQDITANRQDQQRCETWRGRIARQILSMPSH